MTSIQKSADDDEARPPSAADGGLYGRRRFVQTGLVAGGAALLSPRVAAAVAASASDAAPPQWMREPGHPFANYGQPSPYEKGVIRWVAANPGLPGNGVSWTPLQDLDGAITPSPLHFERHHNGVPDIDPQRHRLRIDGHVTQPMEFSVDALLRYPREGRQCFIECGGNSSAGWHPDPIQARVGHFHGLVSGSEWTGVPLRVLLREAGISGDAHWLIAEGADAAGLLVSLPLGKALDDVIVALYQNGERIRPENGYPMRLVVPGWEGIVNVKWLRRISLATVPLMSRFETSKYTDLLSDGKARQFSFQMKAKSVITFPSPGSALPVPGWYEIRGLAWSGAGRIARVDVSVDSGAHWTVAELQEPVLAASLTRFRASWRWWGDPTVLLSRAIDETGYVQPSRAKLIAERGEQGYYHYNAIVSWQVTADGDVQHVYG
jgi:sulfane dehydrogenase subunit SoxC